MSFPLEFGAYEDKCTKEISSLQEEFTKLYDVISYEEWFYDHGTAIFHFKSHDGRNLYFRYVDVGSFSTNTNTWMWSWYNESTPNHVTTGLEKVKAFGTRNNFAQLTQGLIDGDEFTGWAMTSIAAKLLNGIGVYRIPDGHLFAYFIFTNELSQDEYDTLMGKYIECETHGTSHVAFICQHLNKDKYTGFHEAFESNPLSQPIDDYQAWCDECETARLKEGGWNEVSENFAKIKLVCNQCYFEIKRKNIQ
jgi:hypothetical protein